MSRNRIQNPERKKDLSRNIVMSSDDFTIFLGLFGVILGEEGAPDGVWDREEPRRNNNPFFLIE